MAFDDLETKRIEKSVAAFLAKRRPPPHIRSELDIACRISGQSLEVFEIRPQWNNRSVIREHAVAKATFVRTTNCWRVFWKRADLKWHGYEPNSTAKDAAEFLAIVDQDPYGCFFG